MQNVPIIGIDISKKTADQSDVGEKSRQKMEHDLSTLRGNTDQKSDYGLVQGGGEMTR